MRSEELSREVIQRAEILGLGSGLPETVLDNHYFEKIVETSDEWIRERSGIRERRMISPNETNSDLAMRAGKAALEDAGLAPEDMDVVIVSTCTPDRTVPACAVAVQDKLGARNAAAFDLNAACSGFIYGLIVANGLIISHAASRVLVIGSDVLTRWTNFKDRTTCVLFADGAGAAVLGPSTSDKGIMGYYFKSDGRLRDLITVPAGGTETPASHATVDADLHFIQMKGNDVYKYAVSNLADSARKALEHAGMTAEQVDLVIPHQANTRILESVAKRLKIDYEKKFFINIDHTGNTSAASIPIALAEAKQTGRIHKGQTLLCVAFGGGLTYGGIVIKY
jgi:3-oxoacyl-[acyl-carrier-protein] synthase III